MFSTFAITAGSIPEGKEGTLSTAFFTSDKTTSIFFPFSTSIFTLAEFSLDTEVTLSTPTIPFKLSSIFNTTPSSISCGEAPGYANEIFINCESVSGKKEDFIFKAPTNPNKTKAIINILTATGNLIKYVIIFFIQLLFINFYNHTVKCPR